MRRLAVGLSLLLLSCLITVARAEPWHREHAEDGTLADLMPQPTEEMWFYLQELRRHDDPQQAIRRGAEFKTAQRRMRIESRKWFGYSPSRPTASPIPTMGVHSPMWVGNTGDPYRWVGGGVIRVANVTSVVESESSAK
jgi:hypothetical protein